MSCLWTIIFLSFIFLNLSEAKHQHKLHSAVVVGTVYCDTCFHQDFSKAGHFISGASVAVECEDTGSRPGFREEVKTNEHGEFKVNLPFSVSKHVKKIKGCSVKLIKSGEPFCAVAATATSSSLHLKSRKEGEHIYSAGFFTFKPLKQPELCDQKPAIKKSPELKNQKSFISDPNNPTFAPPLRDPSDPPPLGQFFPPLPELPPLPRLPNLPPLPGMPNLPPALPKKLTTPKGSTTVSQLSTSLVKKKVTDSFLFPPIIPLPPNPLLPPPSIIPLPPNPLQPPPSILPPNPFQPPPSVIPPIFPSPPPSIFPPILPTPSPSPPGFNLPPLIPGLIPSPPPPSPRFPFIPLPPFPFQPTPGFPGVPPAVVSSSPKRTPP